MGNIVKKFPTLYAKDREERVRVWDLWVEEISSKVCNIVSSHGLDAGKKQIDTIEITTGKNLGRANETTSKEQAISDAQSKWNSKIDKGYAESISTIPEDILPMLAKRYDQGNNKEKITYPCYVQPKLDGVRCLAKRVKGVIEFISRKGKQYQTLTHIEKELKEIMDVAEVFDGEIYIHGENFQDIISAVKNVKHKSTTLIDSNRLEYHIYDLADKTKSFRDRYDLLESKFKGKKFKYLKLVRTGVMTSEKGIKPYHRLFVDDGYEGLIIRNMKGKYEFNVRSNNLQKYKEFFDEEFEIIGAKEGIGRFKGCATFTCITKSKKSFDCNMKCSYDKKKHYWKYRNDYIGQLLTVRYQEKSKDKIPRFPVGIAIRDYE